MIPIENMRSLDTATLVTLKQRIERELMRRGDVEQFPAETRMVYSHQFYPQLGWPSPPADVLLGSLPDEMWTLRIERPTLPCDARADDHKPASPDPVQVAKELMGHVAEQAKREGIELDETEIAIEFHRRMREAGDNSELKRQLEQMREGLLAAVENPASVENPDAYMANDSPEALPTVSDHGKLSSSAPTPIAQRRFLREPDGGCRMCRWSPGIVAKDDFEPGSRTVLQLCPCLWGGE